jgi:CBS domain-containing protein
VPTPTRTTLTVTPRSEGGWAVVSGRETLSTHRKKEAAVLAGRRHAKRHAPSRLTIKAASGKIQDHRTYDADARTSAANRTGSTRRVSGKAATRRRAASRTRSAAPKRSRSSAPKRASSGRPSVRQQTVRGIMTPNPRTLPMTASLLEAAQTMREVDAGTVLVADDQEQLTGILTDRDIAIRAVADGLDPLSTRVGDVSSPFPESVSPDTSVRDAVELMRQLNVRRLPVTQGGRAVGILSLGDLAIYRDASAVLEDISTAPSTDRPAGTRPLAAGADVGVSVVDVLSVPPHEPEPRVR